MWYYHINYGEKMASSGCGTIRTISLPLTVPVEGADLLAETSDALATIPGSN
jgi:hypothetical protein